MLRMTTPQELRRAARAVLDDVEAAWERYDDDLFGNNPEELLRGLIYREAIRNWPQDEAMQRLVASYLEHRLIRDDGRCNRSSFAEDMDALSREFAPHRDWVQMAVRTFSWILPTAQASVRASGNYTQEAAYLATYSDQQDTAFNVLVPAHPTLAGTDEEIERLRRIAETPSNEPLLSGVVIDRDGRTLARSTSDGRVHGVIGGAVVRRNPSNPSITELQIALEGMGFETGSWDGQSVNLYVTEGVDHDDGPATQAAREAVRQLLMQGDSTLTPADLDTDTELLRAIGAYQQRNSSRTV
jgi:hypothetical protein